MKIIKHFMFALIIMLVSTKSFCQNSNKTQVIEVGLGINHLLDKNEFSPKIGFGFFLKNIWFYDSRINLVSGLLFEKTRYLDEYDHCGFYCYLEDMNYDIYSFSIPLLLRVNTAKKFRLFFESGPTFEFIPFKYGSGTEVSFYPPDSWSRIEISGDFQHDLIDVGAIIGFGIVFPINDHDFLLTSTYHNSFKSIFDKQNNTLTEYFTVKIGVLIN